jgi:hypothetical protein
MVSILASSVVDREFKPRSGQTKDYKIGICCFSAKHTAVRRKSKDWLVRNQNNVSAFTNRMLSYFNVYTFHMLCECVSN